MSQQQVTDAQSLARFYVTFYVNNPTTSDIQVDWLFCRSDSSGVVVDGTTVTTPSDGDGVCKDDVSFTLSPGAHVVQIHDRDSNNVLEGFGIRNTWIETNGLEIDFDALQAANDAGIIP